MDDYALQQELEALAGNAWVQPTSEASLNGNAHEPISITMSRWQKLFGFSADEAIDRIMDHRNDLTRARTSDEHWETVRDIKEAEGHDRESYEFELQLEKTKAALLSSVPTVGDGSDDGITYLVELSGPLETAEEVQRAAQMETVPITVHGTSTEDHRQVELCCIDSRAKGALLKWASEEGGGFEPIILVNPRSMR